MDNQRPGFFERLVELLGWVRIAASPALVGGIGAFLLALSGNSTLAVTVLVLGILIGAAWATRVWRKQGTVNFLTVNHTFSDGRIFQYRLIPVSDGGTTMQLSANEFTELQESIKTILHNNGFTGRPDAVASDTFRSANSEIRWRMDGEQTVILDFDDTQLAKHILEQLRKHKVSVVTERIVRCRSSIVRCQLFS
jgi:hypothetical protein